MLQKEHLFKDIFRKNPEEIFVELCVFTDFQSGWLMFCQ